MRTTIPKKIEMMGTAAVYRRRIERAPGSFPCAICLVFASIRMLTVQRSNACRSAASSTHDPSTQLSAPAPLVGCSDLLGGLRVTLSMA
jgi:hypothetical protein